ncbi:MAG: NAD-binding protein, partial [Actinomycetota bacterium]|nr:NAD-binding protein [Actinomycetota bacterium]
KSLAATILVLVLRYPINTALIMGASLAQIGEFSFVLAGLGLSLAILPAEGVSLVVAAAFISIALNPMMFLGMKVFKKFVMMRVAWARKFDYENDELAILPDGIQEEELSGHVILVGYGRVGKRIFEQFTKQGITVVVIDYSRERIEDLREHGHIALAGDGSQPAMLTKAGVERAAAVFVAAPDSTSVRNATEAVRALNPTVEIVMRTHSKEESQFMDAIALGRAFFGEQELADSMISPVLKRLKDE